MMKLWNVLGLTGLAALVGGVLADDLVPLPLKLPRPAFTGTPQNVEDIESIDPIDPKRPVPQVPQGIAQLALHKPVTSSSPPGADTKLEQATDGQKEAYEDTFVELRPRLQWLQVDLGDSYRLYDICLWHYHCKCVLFHDVVVQVSNDAEFKAGVTTLFNNDRDNSAGFGAGSGREYWESYLGKLIACGGVSARYVRCYSRGSTGDDPLNRYTELEVWGMPK